jgi:hypothetical protein
MPRFRSVLTDRMPTNPTRTIDIIGTGIIDIGTERERTNREAAPRAETTVLRTLEQPGNAVQPRLSAAVIRDGSCLLYPPNADMCGARAMSA